MLKASTNNNWALASIKQFDGDPLNWSTFKKDIQVYCDDMKGIWDVVSPPPVPAPAPTPAASASSDVCFRCGVAGHFAPECVLDMPQDVKERILKELKKKRKSSEEKSGTENAAILWCHINDDGDISGSSDSEELATIADFVGFIGAETTPGSRKASASSLTKRGRTMHPLKSTPPSTSISDSSQNSSNVSVIQGVKSLNHKRTRRKHQNQYPAKSSSSQS